MTRTPYSVHNTQKGARKCNMTRDRGDRAHEVVRRCACSAASTSGHLCGGRRPLRLDQALRHRRRRGAWTNATAIAPPRAGPPDGARRDADAELEQLSGDPRVAPPWVLPRQAQNEFANAPRERRPTAGPLRLRPSAAHQLSVPTQQRLRRAISRSNIRPRLLPTKHQQLMAQNQQFDLLGELAAAAPHEQPQQRPEGEIRTGKEHPPKLPKPAVTDIQKRNLVLKPLTLVFR
jgi:hypothetical protein